MAVAGPTIVSTSTGIVSLGSSITVSCTVASGQALLVAVTTFESGGSNLVPTSVVFNGTEALAELADTVKVNANTHTRTSFFWLADPTATTADVVVTYPGNVTDGLAGCMVIRDAGAVQPLNTSLHESAGGTRMIANAWSTQTSALVVACALKESSTAWLALGGSVQWNVDLTGNRSTGRSDKEVASVATLPDTIGFYVNALADVADQTCSIVVIRSPLIESTVDDDVLDNLNEHRGMKAVWTTQLIGYVFFLNAAGVLQYRKTTDQGVTWGTAVTVYNPGGGTVMNFDLWYDQWNAGKRKETQIHIALLWEFLNDDSWLYIAFDVADDSFTAASQIIQTIGISTDPSETTIAICKANGGYLYVASRHFGDPTNDQFFRSMNGGQTWDAFSDWGFNAIETRIKLFPAATADPNDIVLIEDSIFFLGLYLFARWENATNSWGPATTFGSANSPPDYLEFAGVIRHSDGSLFIAHWENFGNSTNDLRLTEITSTGTIQHTRVVENDSGGTLAGIAICQSSDTIFVFYGSGTIGSAMDIFYKSSTDGGTTWSAATQVNNLTVDIRHLDLPPSVGGQGGGRIQAFWFDDDLNDIITEHTGGLTCPGTTPLLPDIAVYLNLLLIVDGSTIALPQTTVGNVIDIQFIIRNEGTNDLILGTVSVTGDGSLDAGDDPSDEILNPLDQTTVTVSMDTSTTGAKSAELIIPSNDPDENPYNITITLTVKDLPVFGEANCTRYRCRMPGPGIRRDEEGFVNQP